MEKLKKILKNKKVASLSLAVICAASLFVGTFAWFTGTIPNQGVDVNTGKLEVNSNAYTYNPSHGEENPILNRTKVGGASEGQTVIASLEEKKNDNIYFIVERSTECIDVDYLVTWTLENGTKVGLTDDESLEEIRYIGGFWFQFSKINADDPTIPYKDWSTPEITYSVHENKLASFIEKNQGSSILIGDPTKGIPLFDIATTPVRGDLKETSYVDYYVMNYGYRSDITELANRTLQLRMNVDYAQIGGLPGEQREGTTIYVTSDTQLANAVKSYLPGNTIRITGSCTYNGDLVFQAPVHLEIANATLTVYGNMIFKHPYSDTSSIDTSCGGKIFVLTKNGSGGMLDVNVPQGKFIFIGKGANVGTGDIYVQGNLVVNASYNDDLGVVFEKSNFYETTTSGGATTSRKTVYYRNDTRIEVAGNTTIDSFYPYPSVEEGDTAPEYIKIVNYGTILTLNFWSLNYITTYITKPQIDVDNFNIIGKTDYYRIDLPYWATKFGYNGESLKYYGNCRIRQEITSNDFVVFTVEQPGFDNPFTNDDIEKDELKYYIVENDGDPTDITVYYKNHNDTTYTLKQIFQEHYHIPDTSSKMKTFKKMKIVCAKTNIISLSTDLSFIKTATNLEVLDLENSLIPNNNINIDRPFSGLSKLSTLVLPKNLTTIKGYLLSGTNVREITLPDTLTSFNAYSFYTERNSSLPLFERITYWHITNTVATSPVATGDDGASIYLVPSDVYGTFISAVKDGPNSYWKVVIEGEVTKDYKCVYRYYEGKGYYLNSTVNNYATNDDIVIDTIAIDSETIVPIYGINSRAFWRYSYTLKQKFNSITFGDSVKLIGYGSFYYQPVNTIDLNQVEEIYGAAFSYSTVTNIINANHLTLLNGDVFYNCDSLLAFESSSLKTIGTSCFNNCNVLEIIKTPNLESLSEWSICACPSLFEVYIGDVKTFVADKSIRDNSNLRFIFYCVTSISEDSYLYSSKLSNFLYGQNATCRFVANDNVYNSATAFFTSYSGATTSYDYSYRRHVTFTKINPLEINRSGDYYLGSLNVGEIFYDTYINTEGILEAEIISFTNMNITSDYTTPGWVNYKGEDIIVGRIDACYAGLNINCKNFTIHENTWYCDKLAGRGDNGSTVIKKVTEVFRADGIITISGFYVGNYGDVYFSNATSMYGFCFHGDFLTHTYKNIYLPKLKEVKGDYCFYNVIVTGAIYMDAFENTNGYSIFYGRFRINELHMNGLKIVNSPMLTGDSWDNNNNIIKYIYMNGVETVTGRFFYSCCCNEIEMNSLKTVSVTTGACFGNLSIYEGDLYFPSLTSFYAPSYGRMVIKGSMIFPKCTYIYGFNTWTFSELIAPKLKDIDTYGGPKDRAVQTYYCPSFTSNVLFYNTNAGTIYHWYVNQNCHTGYSIAGRSANRIYLCGTGSTVYTAPYNYGTNYTIKVFVHHNAYENAIKYYTPAKGYYVIDCGNVDPAEIYYLSSEEKVSTYVPAYQYVIDGEAATLIDCFKNIEQETFKIGGNVTVLDKRTKISKEYVLTEIASCAFRSVTMNCQNLIITDTILKVGSYAFDSKWCSTTTNKSFETIQLNSPTYIGDYAFARIESINSVVLGESVTYVGTGCFNAITEGIINILNQESKIEEHDIFGLTPSEDIHITVPCTMYSSYTSTETWNRISKDNIYSINEYYYDETQHIRFYYQEIDANSIYIVFAESLEEIIHNATIPTSINIAGIGEDPDIRNVTVIDSMTLTGIQGLKNIVLPTYLESFKFNKNLEPTTLKSYSFADGVSNAYYTCNDGILYKGDYEMLLSYPKAKVAVDGTYTVPSTVVAIPSFAFDGNNSLSTITISGNSNIMTNAFYGLSNLSQVIINGNVSIQSLAFNNTKITSFEINGVITVHSGGFSGVSEGVIATFTNAAPSIFDGYDTFGALTKFIVYVPEESLSLYKANILFDGVLEKHMFATPVEE